MNALDEQISSENSPIMQQITMLNLRINDMMFQLNTVIKMVMDENSALKKELATMKGDQCRENKTKL